MYRVVDFGTLEVTASVPGAEVRVNGRRVGHTPLTLPDVPEGQVTVQMSRSGYDSVSQIVNVGADVVSRVRPPTCAPRPEPCGWTATWPPAC